MKKAASSEKIKQRVAIVLVAIAVLVIGRAFLTTGGPKSEPATPATSTSAGKTTLKLESLDPRLRLDLLANAEDVKYEGRGKNIFSAAEEPIAIQPVKTSPLLQRQEAQAAAAAAAGYRPPPPPINLKYFGITNAKGEKPKAFLSQGEDVWIAHEGDVVNRHYKIIRISPTSIEVEDLLNNNRQSIRLSEG
jgi:hypothetical protein